MANFFAATSVLFAYAPRQWRNIYTPLDGTREGIRERERERGNLAARERERVREICAKFGKLTAESEEKLKRAASLL